MPAMLFTQTFIFCVQYPDIIARYLIRWSTAYDPFVAPGSKYWHYVNTKNYSNWIQIGTSACNLQTFT
jgi:hypothetical protein